MAILAADPHELYLSGTTCHGPSIADSGSSFAIGDLNASGYQAQRYRSVIDALGEGTRLRLAEKNGGGASPGGHSFTAELLYFSWPVQWSDASPANNSNKLIEIVGSTFFNGWHFRLETSGKIALYNASNVQQVLGSKVLSDNTIYHLLLGCDATNGILSLWIGDDDGTWNLNDPTQWSGTADITTTDATQNGTIAGIYRGWWSVGKTNPASTWYGDGMAVEDTKPTKTRFDWYIPADASAAASEYETGGGSGTAWTDEGGSGATTEKVDDGIQADDDGTYVVAEAGVGDGARWSCHVGSCASVGIPSDHDVLAIIPIFRVRKETASADLTDMDLFIRYGGVNADAGVGYSRTTTYRQMWQVYTAGPSAEALTQTLVDGLEIGLVRTGTSSSPASTTIGYRCTQAGLIVVTEKADAVAGGMRRRGVIVG